MVYPSFSPITRFHRAEINLDSCARLGSRVAQESNTLVSAGFRVSKTKIQYSKSPSSSVKGHAVCPSGPVKRMMF
ncbi:hypothetical protein HBI56_062230 [Parastagonospora nodorum]|uniref:Uncharacterized protein n=1 Tax=Phaeosphaeria nodorum (strain SN15 / ATCC MYA-4574 / FGSC 10173) TaxID=321614 RepID=A0A7U2F2N1_PHANO|nr:hypothetical protein HBH56_156320 [Parastagonospora nodorum]QRC97553.1 hypothetical protein JI435_410740 [Parastagonospora nodorum SN15]KAH3922883.1 hypothetical protein HBH54_218400 [Parastagonospora nodorum]KAH3973618.1 hypothetical protein HBH51_098770 [Parastagonospora nodorum]KAH4002539.1 hypothetical protein HBI10_075090 [Parastagonospora nodorum]